MAGSVGPLKVGVAAQVGDLAGPIRDALAQASSSAGSYSEKLSRKLSAIDRGFDGVKKSAQRASKETSAWYQAMEEPATAIARRREGKAYADTVSGVQWGLGGPGTSPSKKELSLARMQRRRRELGLGGRENLIWDSAMATTLTSAEAEAAASAGSVMGSGAAGVAAAGTGGRRRGPVSWLVRQAGKQLGLPFRGLGIGAGTGMLGLGAGLMYMASQRDLQKQLAAEPLGLNGAYYGAIERRATREHVSVEDVTKGIGSLRTTMADARRGGPEGRFAASALATAGITQGDTTDQAISKAIGAIDRTVDPVQKLALATELFGENAAKTIRTLRGMTPPTPTEEGEALVRARGAENVQNIPNWLMGKISDGYSQEAKGIAGVWSLVNGGSYGEGVKTYNETIAGEAAKAKQDAEQKARDDEAAVHRYHLNQEGKAAVGGKLATPEERFAREAATIRETAAAGGYGAPGSAESHAYMARAALVAGGEYANAQPKPAGLAAAAETQSVQGYSQIVEAIYARETAADVAKQTNALLDRYFPELIGAVRQQRGFQHTPAVASGPK